MYDLLFAGWEVNIGKNCDRGLENAGRGHRPKAAFSSPRSRFFTMRSESKPENNMFMFFSFSKLVLQITNGFVHSTVPLNRPACRLLTIGSYRKRLDRSRASD